jgi:hypothetical protein
MSSGYDVMVVGGGSPSIGTNTAAIKARIS